MKITINIDDVLYQRAKKIAVKTNRPLRAVVEDALRQFLDTTLTTSSTDTFLPLSKQKPGLRAGVNLDDSASLLDLMEGGELTS